MPLRRVRKPFFGPIKLPTELLFEIDPVFRDRDGRKLRRWRFGDPVSGQIVEEIPNEEHITAEPVVPKSMSIPSSSVFGVSYTYGRSDFQTQMPDQRQEPEPNDPTTTMRSRWPNSFNPNKFRTQERFPVGVLLLVVVLSVLLGLFFGSR